MIAFNKYYNQFNILSVSLVVVSLFFLIFKGLNFGIDFKGGTLIELRSNDNKINVSRRLAVIASGRAGHNYIDFSKKYSFFFFN